MKTLKIVFNSPVQFEVETKENISFGDFIVVETSRGIELAKCVGFGKKEKKVEEKTETEFENGIDETKITFVKKATEKEIKTNEANKEFAKEVKIKTKELARKYNLEMKISEVSSTLDKTKVSIFFTAENRVDFRDLVKELAGKFKTRIELRQIGSRDETRAMGGFGPCGKECCCKEFLNEFEHVSIKMAKNQNLSLNPTKISGLCGRLLCCLGYENEHYAETNKLMPKVNSFVITPQGEGKVVYNDLLKRIVQVRIGDENNFEIKNFELKEIKKKENNGTK